MNVHKAIKMLDILFLQNIVFTKYIFLQNKYIFFSIQNVKIGLLVVFCFSAEKFHSLPEKDQSKHMKAILDNINSSEKGPPSQKRIQLLHYMASFCSDKGVSGYLVKNEVLSMLARQLKEITHTEV